MSRYILDRHYSIPTNMTTKTKIESYEWEARRDTIPACWIQDQEEAERRREYMQQVIESRANPNANPA
jgi:hypothetical protein